MPFYEAISLILNRVFTYFKIIKTNFENVTHPFPCRKSN